MRSTVLFPMGGSLVFGDRVFCQWRLSRWDTTGDVDLGRDSGPFRGAGTTGDPGAGS